MFQEVLFCVPVIPAISIAQLPHRVEKCLPYPTFAQEIRPNAGTPRQGGGTVDRTIDLRGCPSLAY